MTPIGHKSRRFKYLRLQHLNLQYQRVFCHLSLTTNDLIVNETINT